MTKMIPIRNPKFKLFLKKKINYYYSYNKDLFPATIPILMSKDDIEKLENYEYMSTMVLDSKRVLLFFVTDYYGNNLSIICDRLFNFYCIDIDVLDIIYKGTLFDCEMISDNIYLNDIISYCGDKIRNTKFSDRLTSIDYFINISVKSSKFNLLTKPHFKMEDYPVFISEYPDAKKGILFIPNTKFIFPGVQKSYLKWLPNEEQSIDLQVSLENEDIIIYTYNYRNKIKYAKISSEVENGKLLIDKIKNLEFFTDNCIVKFLIKDGNLLPSYVKTDKVFPNGLRIIELVLYTINQNLNMLTYNKGTLV